MSNKDDEPATMLDEWYADWVQYQAANAVWRNKQSLWQRFIRC